MEVDIIEGVELLLLTEEQGISAGSGGTDLSGVSPSIDNGMLEDLEDIKDEELLLLMKFEWLVLRGDLIKGLGEAWKLKSTEEVSHVELSLRRLVVLVSLVLVKALQDFLDFTGFWFFNLEFSTFRELSSDFNFLRVSERFSDFWSSL